MAAMKFPLIARWTEEEVVRERKVNDVAGAMSLFNELDASGRHHPTMVEFENGDGGAIAIGAGRDVTVITAQHSIDPPYFTSQAKGAPDDDEYSFLYAGENTPYPGSSVVPKKDGVRPLEHFLRSGELDPDLDWEKL
jgi:hypothetical protein